MHTSPKIPDHDDVAAFTSSCQRQLPGQESQICGLDCSHRGILPVTLVLERALSLAFFAIKGFLGTGATFEADLNLLVQVVMGVALVAGALLAKRKRYTAHGICQTTVLFLSLGMIALVMWPSRVNTLRPALAESCMKWHLRGGYDSFACRRRG
jgi:hypothetical protein